MAKRRRLSQTPSAKRLRHQSWLKYNAMLERHALYELLYAYHDDNCRCGLSKYKKHFRSYVDEETGKYLYWNKQVLNFLPCEGWCSCPGDPECPQGPHSEKTRQWCHVCGGINNYELRLQNTGFYTKRKLL